jgi:hypothetical protein
MAAGEKMKFRMWDSLLNIEVPASATYGPFQVYPPDSTYGQDLYSFLASLSGISAPAVPVLSSPANGAGNQSVSSLGLSWSTSAVFPNPFKDHINIAFDVPSMNGTSLQDIEINVFDFKGTLVHTLAKGKYAAGHYVLSWDFLNGRDGYQSSEIYVIQMKAQKFEKRVKVIRIR